MHVDHGEETCTTQHSAKGDLEKKQNKQSRRLRLPLVFSVTAKYQSSLAPFPFPISSARNRTKQSPPSNVTKPKEEHIRVLRARERRRRWQWGRKTWRSWRRASTRGITEESCSATRSKCSSLAIPTPIRSNIPLRSQISILFFRFNSLTCCSVFVVLILFVALAVCCFNGRWRRLLQRPCWPRRPRPFPRYFFTFSDFDSALSRIGFDLCGILVVVLWVWRGFLVWRLMCTCKL